MFLGFIDIGAPFILGITTFFFVVNLALVVLIGSKQPASRVFVLMSVAVAFWVLLDTIAYSVNGQTTNSPTLFFLMENIIRVTYFVALLLVSSFFYFCYRFPDIDDRSNRILLTLSTFILISTPFFFFTDLITPGDKEWWIAMGSMPMGPLMPVYTAIVAGFIGGGIFLVYSKAKKATNLATKKQMKFMLIGLSAGFVPPVLFDLVFPLFGYWDFEFLGILTPNIWVGVIAYSIMKYNQMNVRVIFAEALVMIAILLLFITLFI